MGIRTGNIRKINIIDRFSKERYLSSIYSSNPKRLIRQAKKTKVHVANKLIKKVFISLIIYSIMVYTVQIIQDLYIMFSRF